MEVPPLLEELQREYLHYLHENGVPDARKRKTFNKKFDDNAKSIHKKSKDLCETAKNTIRDCLKEIEPIPNWIQDDSNEMQIFKEVKEDYENISEIRSRRMCFTDYLEWLNNKVIPMNLNYKEAWKKYRSCLGIRSQNIMKSAQFLMKARKYPKWFKENDVYLKELADNAAEYFNNNNREDFETSVQQAIRLETAEDYQRAYLHYLYEKGVPAENKWRKFRYNFNWHFKIKKGLFEPCAARNAFTECLKETLPVFSWIRNDPHEMRIFEEVKDDYNEKYFKYENSLTIRRTFLVGYLEWLNNKVIPMNLNYSDAWREFGASLPAQINEEISKMQIRIQEGHFPRWFKNDQYLMKLAKNAEKHFKNIEEISECQRATDFLEWLDREVMPFNRDYYEAWEIYRRPFSIEIQDRICQIKKKIENGNFHYSIQNKPRLVALANTARNYFNNLSKKSASNEESPRLNKELLVKTEPICAEEATENASPRKDINPKEKLIESPRKKSNILKKRIAVAQESAKRIKIEPEHQVQDEPAHLNKNFLETTTIPYNNPNVTKIMKATNPNNELERLRIKCQQLEKELELRDNVINENKQMLQSKDLTIFNLATALGQVNSTLADLHKQFIARQ